MELTSGLPPIGSKITEVTRQAVIDALIQRTNSYHGKLDSLDFLKRIWPLKEMPSTDPRFGNAEADIRQHTVNNDDWDDQYLLVDRLRLLNCSDQLFLKFAETAVDWRVGDREEVDARLREINSRLRVDGFRLVEADRISSRPIYKARVIGDPGSGGVRRYDVAFSFAGEDRRYVEETANYLSLQGVAVFYDRYEKANLWGEEWTETFDLRYRKEADYCVMFISVHYANKRWPIHERRSAMARAVEERQEYILPARFDDAELPGLRPTVGYIDLSVTTPRELGKLILQKLGRHVPSEP